MKLTPVSNDPFAAAAPIERRAPKLVPVDHDPFARPKVQEPRLSGAQPAEERWSGESQTVDVADLRRPAAPAQAFAPPPLSEAREIVDRPVAEPAADSRRPLGPTDFPPAPPAPPQSPLRQFPPPPPAGALRHSEAAPASRGTEPEQRPLLASTSRMPGHWTKDGTASRASQVYAYLRSRGAPEYAAAAIVGHGIAESNLRPDATGDGGMSKGAWQWNRERLDGLRSFAAEQGREPSDWQVQADYVLHELQTTEKAAGDRLFAAQTPEDAARAFMAFERPAGYTSASPESGHNWHGRLRNTLAIVNSFSETDVPDAPLDDVWRAVLEPPPAGSSERGTLQDMLADERSADDIRAAKDWTPSDTWQEVPAGVNTRGLETVQRGDLTFARKYRQPGGRGTPIDLQSPDDVNFAAHRTAEPTPGQAAAGNYAKRRLKWQGMRIAVETEGGKERAGVGKDGKPWTSTSPVPYGYLSGSKAKDGDAVDVYLGPNPKSGQVFVIDQIDPETGKYDEVKTLVGFESEAEARQAYEDSFSDGSGGSRIGAMTPMSVRQFQNWINNGNTKKPVGDLDASPMRTLDSFMRGAADTSSFGFADEVAAGLGAATGISGEFGNYSGNLEAQRSTQRDRDAKDPIASFAGRMTGAILSAVAAPAMLASKGVTLAQRTMRGIGGGAATGGAYGFGSGEGIQDRIDQAFTGAKTGAAVGALLPSVLTGLRKSYGLVTEATTKPAANAVRAVVNPEANALRLTERALKRDRLTPQMAAARLERAQAAGDDTTMLLDVAGDNTRRLARFASNMPGEGGEKLRSSFVNRQLAQSDRVSSAVRRGLRDPEEFYQTFDDLAQSRQAYADPMYQVALSKPVVWNDRLKQFFADPIFKAGMAQGVKIQRLESLAKGEKFDPFDYAVTGFNEAGDPIIGAIPNMRTVNVVKKGFDAMLGSMRNPVTGKLTEEGNALNMVRREFLKEVDSANPAYKNAREVYASHIDAQFALDRGRDLYKADAGAAAKAYRAMTGGEQEFARIGYAKALQDEIAKTRDGLDVAKKIFATPRQRQIMRMMFPDKRSFDEFRASMLRETAKTRSKNAIQGNSTTAQQMADIADNQVDTGIVGNLLAGRPMAAAGAAVQKALSRATVVNERSAKEIADILTSSDPAVSKRILAELQALAVKDKRVERNLNRARYLIRNAGIVGGAQQTERALAE